VRFVVVAGNTQTATIEGISAAGANPAVMAHTPSADLEIVEYGRPILAPVVPVSPTGCPTPAAVTRAAIELLDVEFAAVDAGLARRTAAPTVRVGQRPGRDIRESVPVPDARDLYDAAREFGGALPDDELVVGETIPGGTTTAMGVLDALGERSGVSSSLPENPLSLKREVVAEALTTSDTAAGEMAGTPLEAVRAVGDPVLAVVAGLVVGGAESGKTVTLAGGTQLAAAAAVVRHLGVDAPLTLATTSFVTADETAAIEALAADLDLSLTVTDPAFERGNHVAMDAYLDGEAKEGVGMGGMLAVLSRRGVPMADLRDRFLAVYDRLAPESTADR
jgi:uncharacterized protein (TIGR00303 family)